MSYESHYSLRIVSDAFHCLYFLSLCRTFFSVSGDTANGGSLSYQKGYERIPTNWYRRQIGNDYNLVAFVSDILRVAEKVPGIISVGGNVSFWAPSDLLFGGHARFPLRD